MSSARIACKSKQVFYTTTSPPLNVGPAFVGSGEI